MNRCDVTELPTDQCSHCLGQDEPEPFPIRWERSLTEARWPGSCAHCGDRFSVGDLIARGDLRGDGTGDEWCIYEHTRSPHVGY